MKNANIAPLALLAMLLLLPLRAEVQQTSAPPSSSCDLTAEDYSVYSAILNDLGRPEDPEEEWRDKPDIIISDSTDSSQNADQKGWGFRSHSNQSPLPETIKSFDARAKVSCRLQARFTAKMGPKLVSSKAIESIFKKHGDGWKRFYEQYPKSSGHWSLSNVGYSENRLEALVYVGHYCGWLCGTGHLVLLAKENGGWVVKNRVMLWIS